MADLLDVDQPIVEMDPKTREFKATAYFEDYLYKIIAALGGEGTTLINSTSAESSAILSAQIKGIQKKLNEIDTLFETYPLWALIKDVDARTANFVSKIKTANYDVKNKDWVEARNGILLTFPTNPVRDDEIMVSNGDGSQIKIWGNGYNFKYTSTDSMFVTRNMGSSYHFQFFEDNVLNERYWRVR